MDSIKSTSDLKQQFNISSYQKSPSQRFKSWKKINNLISQSDEESSPNNPSVHPPLSNNSYVIDEENQNGKGSQQKSHSKQVVNKVGNVLRFVGKHISSEPTIDIDPVRLQMKRLEQIKQSIKSENEKLLQEILPNSQLQDQLEFLLHGGNQGNRMTTSDALKKLLSDNTKNTVNAKYSSTSIATSPMPQHTNAFTNLTSPTSSQVSQFKSNPSFDIQNSVESQLQLPLNSPLKSGRKPVKAPVSSRSDYEDGFYSPDESANIIQRRKLNNRKASNTNNSDLDPIQPHAVNHYQAPQALAKYSYFPVNPYGPTPAYPSAYPIVQPNIYPTAYQNQYSHINPFVNPNTFGTMYPSIIPPPFHAQSNITPLMYSTTYFNSSAMPQNQMSLYTPQGSYSNPPNEMLPTRDPQLLALESENIKLMEQLLNSTQSTATATNSISNVSENNSVIDVPTISNNANVIESKEYKNRKFSKSQTSQISEYDHADKFIRKDSKMTPLEKKHLQELSILDFELEKLKKRDQLETFLTKMESSRKSRLLEQQHEQWLIEQQRQLEMLQVRQILLNEQRVIDQSGNTSIPSVAPSNQAPLSQSLPIQSAPADSIQKRPQIPFLDKKINSVKDIKAMFDVGKEPPNKEFSNLGYNVDVWKSSGVGEKPDTKLATDAKTCSFSVFVDGFTISPEHPLRKLLTKESIYRYAIGFYDSSGSSLSKLIASDWKSMGEIVNGSSEPYLFQSAYVKKSMKNLLIRDPVKCLIELQCRSQGESLVSSLGWATISCLEKSLVQSLIPQSFSTRSLIPSHEKSFRIGSAQPVLQSWSIHNGMWRVPYQFGPADPQSQTDTLYTPLTVDGLIFLRVVAVDKTTNKASLSEWSQQKYLGTSLDNLMINYIDEKYQQSINEQPAATQAITQFSPEKKLQSHQNLSSLTASSFRQEQMSPSKQKTDSIENGLGNSSYNNGQGTGGLFSSMALAKTVFGAQRLNNRKKSYLGSINEEDFVSNDEDIDKKDNSISKKSNESNRQLLDLKSLSRILSKASNSKSESIHSSRVSKTESPWIAGLPLGPCTSSFRSDRGDGIDIYLPSARFLPDNISATRLTVKVFNSDKRQYGATVTGSSILSSSVMYPHYNLRIKIRKIQDSVDEPLSPHLLLIVRIDGIDEASGSPVVVGYACVKLFSLVDRNPVGQLASIDDIYVNTGGFQLPIYAGSPVSAAMFDESSFQNIPKIPCATLLARITHVPNAGLEISPVSSELCSSEELLPLYSSGSYSSMRAEPSKLEMQAYSGKHLSSRSELSIDTCIANLAEGATIPPRPSSENPEDIQLWLNSIFPSPDNMTSFMDYSSSCSFIPSAGIQISIDQLVNMPSNESQSKNNYNLFGFGTSVKPKQTNSSCIYKVLYSLCPPGLLYKEIPTKECSSTNGIQFTRTCDFEGSTSTTIKYIDGYNTLYSVVATADLFLVIDIKALDVMPSLSGNVPQISLDQSKCYWTIMPMLTDKSGNFFINSGLYQLPLLHGPIPRSVNKLRPISIGDSAQTNSFLFGPNPFDDLLKSLSMGSTGTIEEAESNWLLSNGASVVLRVINPLVKDIVEHHQKLEQTRISTTNTKVGVSKPNSFLLNTCYMDKILSAAAAGASNSSTQPTPDLASKKFGLLSKRVPAHSSAVAVGQNLEKLQEKFMIKNGESLKADSLSDIIRKYGGKEEFNLFINQKFMELLELTNSPTSKDVLY